MRRKYTYFKKVLYIFPISQKVLRRCEGSLKDLYTPKNETCLANWNCSKKEPAFEN